MIKFRKKYYFQDYGKKKAGIDSLIIILYI